MTSPNVNATPQSVSDQIDGIDGGGNQLPWRKVAMFFQAHVFGRAKDYAFPEGPNESASALDHSASLAKLFTRTYVMPDGNEYDAWDMLVASTKYALTQNPHLMDGEPLSKNYTKPATS